VFARLRKATQGTDWITMLVLAASIIGSVCVLVFRLLGAI